MSSLGLVGVYGECRDVASNVHNNYVVLVGHDCCKGADGARESCGNWNISVHFITCFVVLSITSSVYAMT